ncbi:nucleoside transporter C-terminal domain-containing protein [Methyloceanibacter sp.]|uniref:NupC/NupG family nucleoside CNT transporter n=1 Tax=Methyloceanibacter sp. TaxID=1965321 RepID=UPI002BD7E8E1|nr:nucleoside transporter C-terminal domain-containing protein [Methyloceanibacter sp.]HML91373.1 nucleoside transporter C-terminal domain-containing protein [Methyloceanibacter sp.]
MWWQGTFQEALQGVLGILILLAFAWAIGERRNAVSARVVASAMALQFALAVLLLRVPPVTVALSWLNKAVEALRQATLAGTSFVFGYLGGGPVPFEPTAPQNVFILATQGLPLILIVSALSALLFYWRILPRIVQGFAWMLERTMGLGGAVGVAASANVFVGMIEAPLLIRPYLRELSRASLFLVMTAGMATIAGNMFVLYATVLTPVLTDAAGTLMTASVISAPAAVAIAALMVPGDLTGGTVEQMDPERKAASAAEAVVDGTLAGLRLVVSVAALLIVAIALVHLANQALGLLPDVGGASLSLQRILGWVLAPVAWLIGIPWNEAGQAGELMGTKIVLNELVAYLEMAALPEGALSPRSDIILTYALCGFANLGSLGIMLGGLVTMVPERRAEIVALGPKALIAGTIACFLTGAVAGLLA